MVTNVGGLNALIKITSLLQDTQIIRYSHAVARSKQPLFFSFFFLVCLFEKSKENPDLKGHIGLDH